MKLLAKPDSCGRREFVIEEDEAVGFYLYVYEDGRCVRDHLQDTLQLAVDSAFEDYQVPKEAWQRVE